MRTTKLLFGTGWGLAALFAAGQAAAGDPLVTAKGHLAYRDLADGQDKPLANVRVRLMDHNCCGPADEMAQGFTNGEGYFELSGTAGSSPDPYVQFVTQRDGYIDVKTWAGYSHRYDTSVHYNTHGVIDFGTLHLGSEVVANLYAYTAKQYDFFKSQTGDLAVPSYGGNVGVVYPSVINGSTPFTTDDSIHWPTVYDWQPFVVFHEFGHRIREAADGDGAHFIHDAGPPTGTGGYWYPRAHNFGDTTNEGFAFNEGWAEYHSSLLYDPDKAVLETWSPVNGGADDVEGNVAAKLYRLSVACGGYPALWQVLKEQPRANGPERGAVHSWGEYFKAFKRHFPNCTYAGDIGVVTAQDEPAVSVSLGPSLEMYTPGGTKYVRSVSTNEGQLWVPQTWPPGGTFTSAPASAMSSDGMNRYVFGRGGDHKIYWGFSRDGGKFWDTWNQIPSGTSSSAPAVAVSADGQKIFVFVRGDDKKIWQAYSQDGGKSWPRAWVAIGQGLFTSAPAAAVSADGKQVHVFARGNDNRIWRAYSGDGGASWALAWDAITQGRFTSAPAAVLSADGRQLHVLGRGNDNKFYRAYSSNGGSTWSIDWSNIGQGLFTSAPSAALSSDGQRLHVFGRGTDGRIYRAYSANGGGAWPVAWAPIQTGTGIVIDAVVAENARLAAASLHLNQADTKSASLTFVQGSKTLAVAATSADARAALTRVHDVASAGAKAWEANARQVYRTQLLPFAQRAPKVETYERDLQAARSAFIRTVATARLQQVQALGRTLADERARATRTELRSHIDVLIAKNAKLEAALQSALASHATAAKIPDVLIPSSFDEEAGPRIPVMPPRLR